MENPDIWDSRALVFPRLIADSFSMGGGSARVYRAIKKI